MNSTAALWWAVIGAGIYHGVNPGMGWPLAVSAALMERRRGSLFRALAMLGAGHLVAMVLILAPFSLLAGLVAWQREIRIGAAGLVIAMGCYLLINRRHPRILARVKPTRLALWSFLAATAHGAGLMLVPLFLGLVPGGAHAGHAVPVGGSVAMAALVALAHTLAMVVSGGVVALGVYHWLGLKFLSRGWFNLDVVWALSLIGVGVMSLWPVIG